MDIIELRTIRREIRNELYAARIVPGKSWMSAAAASHGCDSGPTFSSGLSVRVSARKRPRVVSK